MNSQTQIRHTPTGFSIYGYFSLLLSSVIISLFTHILTQGTAALTLFTYSLSQERQAFHRMIRIPVLVFVMAVVGSAILFPGISRPGSETGLSPRWAVSLEILFKTFLLLLSVQITATRISASQISRIFERLGIDNLGFVLGIALHMLPWLHRDAQSSRNAMRLRGAFQGGVIRLRVPNVQRNSISKRDRFLNNRNRLRRVFIMKRIHDEIRWMSVILQRLIRHGDTITISARTRGFGLHSTPPKMPPMRRIDCLPLLITAIFFWGDKYLKLNY